MKFIVLLNLIVFAPVVTACSCGGATIEGGFEGAQLVFVGTALDPSQPDAWIAPGFPLRVTNFEVEEVLKGPRRPDSGLVSLVRNSDNCNPSFESGQRYLIFAWWRGGQLPESSFCAPNEVIADDSDILTLARAIADTLTYRPPPLGYSEPPELVAITEAPGQGGALWVSVALNVALGAALLSLLAYRRARAS